MLALCLMLLVTYYALNYAGIIGQGLHVAMIWPRCDNNTCVQVIYTMVKGMKHCSQSCQYPLELRVAPYEVASALELSIVAIWSIYGG